MIRYTTILLLGITIHATGQTTMTGGRVTYLAAGSIYISIGRDQGIEDSTRILVLRDKDTLATLQVFAVSSKSAVCKFVSGSNTVRIDDSVVGQSILFPTKSTPIIAADSILPKRKDTREVKQTQNLAQTEKKQFLLRGRIGLQYNVLLFDDASLNMQQPGMVISLRGDMADVPLKFDIYGTLRLSGRNGASPFSSKATNDSRVYRFSAEYDDQKNIFSVGRILPLYASTIGYIDGISVARRMGKFISGVSIGFQPDPSLQLPSTNTMKFVLFSQYQSNDEWNTTTGMAYGRIWSRAGIEREAVSTSVSFYTLDGLYGYASTDFDLRQVSVGENKFDPTLSLLICSMNYRFSNTISAGVSVDASRPVYSLSSNITIPDSLLDKRLRSGASINMNISFAHGVGFYNVYTLRFGESGFGQEYSNTSSLYYSDVVGSGALARLNYLINRSTYAVMHGYGVNVQRNFLGIDCGVRFQQTQSDIRQLRTATTTKTCGFDMSTLITNQLSLIGSIDVMRGLGTASTSFFLELSRRF